MRRLSPVGSWFFSCYREAGGTALFGFDPVVAGPRAALPCVSVMAAPGQPVAVGAMVTSSAVVAPAHSHGTSFDASGVKAAAPRTVPSDYAKRQ